MTPRLSHILLGFAGVLALLWAFAMATDSCAKHRGEASQQESQVQVIEADHHAQAAQSIPSHQAELAALKAETARARAEVDRLRQKLARSGVAGPAVVPVPLPAIPQPPVGSVGLEDGRGDLVERLQAESAAKSELIEALNTENGALRKENGALESALSDEQKRSSEWEKAFEAERKRAASLQAALSAKPTPHYWSAGVRVEQKLDGSRQIGATARRDLGPAYVEVSGSSDRASIGFGWRF